jgi:hypothetical protein
VSNVERADPAKGLPCHVHLSDVNLRGALQWPFGSAGGHSLHFFDVFDDEARRFLVELPLDGSGLPPGDPRTVHVVILGFGRMGRSIALRAAKMGHFANGQPLRLSVVDRQAAEQRERFLFRHPVLETKEVCVLKFYEMEAESLSARKQMEEWMGEPDTLLHVCVCLDSDARDLEVALRLRAMLERHPCATLQVRFHSRRSPAAIFDTAALRLKVRVFGMLEDTCCEGAFNLEMRDVMPRAIHARFVERRTAGSQRTPSADLALRPRVEVPEDIRESNRQQADHVGIKLRAIGCALADLNDPREAVTQFTDREVELLAEVEHRRWNAERRLAGWRYGTPSDKAERINENIVRWDELHDSTKDYDRETVRDIPEMLRRAKPPKKVVRVR